MVPICNICAFHTGTSTENQCKGQCPSLYLSPNFAGVNFWHVSPGTSGKCIVDFFPLFFNNKPAFYNISIIYRIESLDHTMHSCTPSKNCMAGLARISPGTSGKCIVDFFPLFFNNKPAFYNISIIYRIESLDHTMHSCTPSKNCMAMIRFYILSIN